VKFLEQCMGFFPHEKLLDRHSSAGRRIGIAEVGLTDVGLEQCDIQLLLWLLWL